MSPLSTSPPAAESLRLTEGDFDSLARAQGKSTARASLVERMTVWGAGVVMRLGEIGVSVSGEMRARSNGETARIYFVRERSLRAVLRREYETRGKKGRGGDKAFGAHYDTNAFVALTVARTFVEVSFEVPADADADVKNTRARLADPALLLELVGVLESLPEQFAIGRGLSQDAAHVQAQTVTPEIVRDLAADDARFVVGWRVPRDVALEHSAELGAQLEDAIVALGAVYKCVAWSPDNDWRTRDRTRLRHKREAGARDDDDSRKKKHAKKASREAGSSKSAHARRREASQRESIEIEPAAIATPPLNAHPTLTSSSHFSPRLRSSRGPFANAMLKTSRVPLVTEVDPSIPIEKGTRVRVLAGPFVGKVGIVQELDGKGGARVMLGLLATRVDVKDLIGAAEGRDRRALASSHRKPLPAR